MFLASQVFLVPIETLLPYARNSRTHSDAQVTALAASMREFGFTNPVLVADDGTIVAGHGRVLAARKIGLAQVPTINVGHLSEAQMRAYVIADNKLALESGWDEEILAAEIQALQAAEFDAVLTGFGEAELADLLESLKTNETPKTATDDVPELAPIPITRPGDVWQLGPHRVMCGDSTSADDVARLMRDARAALVHADPPYGMGKEGDGVANDNLYREKLDAFQMAWWRAFRPHLVDNASAYIWGNAADLWRLWYAGGLGVSERMEMRNEIVWDKKSIAGMASADMLCYPVASERCLYFQLGNQFVGNVNTEDFPDSWEPLRGYLEQEAKSVGINPAVIRELCGCGMYAHWFTRSQFTLIPEKHYRTLQDRFPPAFARPWAELKDEWAKVRGSARESIHRRQGVARSYFDNAHDIMRDVWEFPRVFGAERHDHATPKPVAMMERVMRSSLPAGGLCVEPFGGSGSTLMGAQSTDRVCYSMELQPVYVDVIVKRWQAHTGEAATLEGDGRSFAEVSAASEAQA